MYQSTGLLLKSNIKERFWKEKGVIQGKGLYTKCIGELSSKIKEKRLIGRDESSVLITVQP